MTVVIPTRDRPGPLRAALESVLAQEVGEADLEIVVVDDGSSPAVDGGTVPSHPLVRVVRNDVSTGPSASRKLGAAWGTGELVAFLDDDDRWLPGKLSACLSVFREHPEVDVVAHRVVFDGSSCAGTGSLTIEDRPLRRLLLSQPPHLDGVVVRRALHAAEDFDPSFAAAEDLDYLFRLAQRGTFAFLDEVLAVHRSAVTSASAVTLDRRIEARHQLREKHAALFDRPAHAFHLMRLGHLHRRAGHRRQAMSAFVRSIATEPRLGYAWRGLALAILPSWSSAGGRSAGHRSSSAVPKDETGDTWHRWKRQGRRLASDGRRVAEFAVVRTALPALSRCRHRGDLPVLAYHEVPSRQQFEAQLDYVVRHYRPVDLAAVVEAQCGDGSLPPDALLITFDDGHRSVLDAGLPALKERDIPAVLFVVTGLIDSEQPYWWTEVERRSAAGGRARGFTLGGRALVAALKKVNDNVRLQAIEDLRESTPSLRIRVRQMAAAELRRLERSGVAIGSHTVSHPCLHRCSAEKIVAEVGDSYRHLTEVLGHEPLAFAYPNGDHDERVVAAVRDAGYRAAFRFDHQIGPFPAVDPMLVSRVRVNADDPLDRFVLAASGVHPAVHRLRGRR